MKKIRSNRGFTLAEMLIAVMLLALVSVMATVMTSTVLHTTVTMRDVAQAEVLGSEALGNLQNELRFATDVKVDGDTRSVTFCRQSPNTKNCTFALDKTGKIVIRYPDPKNDGEVLTNLLFGGASYGDLSVSELAFVLATDASGAANGAVRISVSVASGSKVLWSGGVSVRPLAGDVTV